MYSEQTQLDQVAQGCVQLNLSVSEDADLMDSLGFCSSMWQPSWRRLFPFFLKICLEFSMLQLGNPFEQRSEGTPSLQDLLLNFTFFFFTFWKQCFFQYRADWHKGCTLDWEKAQEGQVKWFWMMHEVTGISLAALGLEIKWWWIVSLINILTALKMP